MLQHVSLVIFQTGLLTALVWDPGLFFHLCDSDGSTCWNSLLFGKQNALV